jgi:hypothetical protein
MSASSTPSSLIRASAYADPFNTREAAANHWLLVVVSIKEFGRGRGATRYRSFGGEPAIWQSSARPRLDEMLEFLEIAPLQ